MSLKGLANKATDSTQDTQDRSWAWKSENLASQTEANWRQTQKAIGKISVPIAIVS